MPHEPLFPRKPLEPATLSLAPDGTPYSETFGDVYHSACGALGQASHVFVGGNGLPSRWADRERFVICETGFGLGLNFLVTWNEWRDDPRRPGRLHFLSVEKHPFSAGDLASIHAGLPGLASLSAELVDRWPPLVPGFHRLEFEGGRVVLTLLFGDALDCLPRLEAKVDAFYLDGFSPAKNPVMWSEALFVQLARLAKSDATLATWTVAAAVRERLSRAGFAVEKRPGFASKREMTVASRAGRQNEWSETPPPGTTRERRAIVIGAGIAGTSACERLAARGWRVDVIEQWEKPAQEASGNPTGVIMPMLSRDDNYASRLSRACYIFALRQLHSLAVAGLQIQWSACGVLHLARDSAQERLQQAIVEEHAYPSDYASYVSVCDAMKMIGRTVGAGGWLFPRGGWVNPPSVCEGLLGRFGDRVRRLFSRQAVALDRHGDLWRALDGQGTLLAEAPVVILAAGASASQIKQAAGLPLRPIRGQVTHLPSRAFQAPPLVVCREGYLAPAADGSSCVGASFDRDDDRFVRTSSHRGNLERLEHILPGAAFGLDPATLDGRVSFRMTTPDRLPLVGPLPPPTADKSWSDSDDAGERSVSGLYGLLGYGARGLVWAGLSAELLASRLDGDPSPLESDLIEAVSPARFHLRALRHGRMRQ